MTTETEIKLTLGASDFSRLPNEGWTNADWLVAIGTILLEGEYTGVDGKTVNYKQSVVEQIVKTAVNKDIHIFHRNRPLERKEKVGRIYGHNATKGQIKYIAWDEQAIAGIKDGTFKLSLEADLMGIPNGKGPTHYDATRGDIMAVTLVTDPAVPDAVNTKVSAVALEDQQIAEVANAANAEPGIRFPAAAQLSEKDLSPCISLLEKNGLNVSKKGSVKVENENETTETTETTGEEIEVQQEAPAPEPTPTPPPVVEPVPITTEQFAVMQAALATMNTKMEAQSAQLAILEGTDLESIEGKIKRVAPKTDFKVLLAGARDTDEKRLVLNSHLAGLMSRDSPEVNLEGVDTENAANRPDPVQMEKDLYKGLLGTEDPFNEQTTGEQ